MAGYAGHAVEELVGLCTPHDTLATVGLVAAQTLAVREVESIEGCGVAVCAHSVASADSAPWEGEVAIDTVPETVIVSACATSA